MIFRLFYHDAKAYGFQTHERPDRIDADPLDEGLEHPLVKMALPLRHLAHGFRRAPASKGVEPPPSCRARIYFMLQSRFVITLQEVSR